LTGGKFGIEKNPGGHAKINGIFGRIKFQQIFLVDYYFITVHIQEFVNIKSSFYNLMIACSNPLDQ
jgi:hypothetical protein